MGVWLGWHICYNATQVSQGQLRENRNLSWSIRAKAVLIYVLSVPVHNEQYLLAYKFIYTMACHVWKHGLAILSFTFEFYGFLSYFFSPFDTFTWSSLLCVICNLAHSGVSKFILSACIDFLSILRPLLCCHADYLFLFSARGVRKVTTGITGLWPRSVQSDAAFWFFDVGSSYPTVAYGRKGKFVHLPTGNVSWV